MSTCNCMTRCRMSLVTLIDGREYPASTHFEDCHLHIKERFVRVEMDGSWCVMPPEDAKEFIEPNDFGDKYTHSDIYLTRDQYKALPEFEGF